MQTKTKPTCGRVVHVIVKDQMGAEQHRAFMVCEATGQTADELGIDWVISGHVFIKPGDQVGGMWAMSPTAGGVASVPSIFLSNVAPGTTQPGSWHWPEREEAASLGVGEQTKPGEQTKGAESDANG